MHVGAETVFDVARGFICVRLIDRGEGLEVQLQATTTIVTATVVLYPELAVDLADSPIRHADWHKATQSALSSRLSDEMALPGVSPGMGPFLDLGDGAAAAEAAEADPIPVKLLGSSLRSANLSLDIARGWAQADGDRDDRAIRALDAADRAAPAMVRNYPLARELLAISTVASGGACGSWTACVTGSISLARVHAPWTTRADLHRRMCR